MYEMQIIKTKIQARDVINSRSAICSVLRSNLGFWVRKEIKEKIQAAASNKEITEVISSIKLFSCWLVKCKDVITTRHKPNKVEAVFKMCWEVMFGILFFKLNFKYTSNKNFPGCVFYYLRKRAESKIMMNSTSLTPLRKAFFKKLNSSTNPMFQALKILNFGLASIFIYNP